MKSAVLICFGLLAATPARAEPEPIPVEPRQSEQSRTEQVSAFRTWFERQIDHPSALSPAVLATARAYHYVFIAGFLNEGFRVGYFNQNRKALLDAGVKPESIDVIFPKSGNGVEENAAVLQRTLSELAAKGPQKLVLIGHSKGAVEALVFVVSAKAFVHDHVQAVFLVQGTFGGTGLADYVTGTGHPLDDRLPAAQRAELAVAAKGGKLLDAGFDKGFQSLTHQHAAALWARLIPPAGAPRSAPRLPASVADRIFFVRSQRDPESVSPLLSLTARYLAAYYGANDGVVQVEDQWIAGTGRVLATLDADHLALTLAAPVSDRRERTRRAFTYALLMQMAGAFDD